MIGDQHVYHPNVFVHAVVEVRMLYRSYRMEALQQELGMDERMWKGVE